MAQENNGTAVVSDDTTDKLEVHGKGKTSLETPTFCFAEDSWRTDFIINVEGTKLYVSKIILSLASPVFDRMFQSEFKERSSNELTLPGKTLEDMTEFLRCIYPNCLVPVSYENALRLLPLVDQYQVLHLKTRCEHVLVESVDNNTSVEELYRRLKEANMYNLKDLRAKCIAIAVTKKPGDLVEAKKTCNPPVEDLAEIFETITMTLSERLDVGKAENAEFGENELNDGENLEERMEQLEALNAQMSNEVAILKGFISAEVKKTKELVFADTSKWKEEHIILSAPVEERFCSSFQTLIWGIPIRISTSINMKEEYVTRHFIDNIRWLCVEIKCLGSETFACNFNTRCDLVNIQPNGENMSVLDKGSFCNRYQKTIYIKKVDEIQDATAGFIRDGRIGLIVHVYMSEPNKT